MYNWNSKKNHDFFHVDSNQFHREEMSPVHCHENMRMRLLLTHYPRYYRLGYRSCEECCKDEEVTLPELHETPHRKKEPKWASPSRPISPSRRM